MATDKVPTLEQVMSSLPTIKVKSIEDLSIREGYVLYEFITDRVTKGGLILPETSKPLGARGVVLKLNNVKGMEVGDILLIHNSVNSVRIIVDGEPDRWVMVSREDNHLLWTKPDNFLGHE